MLTLRIAGDGVSIDEERFVDVLRGRDDVDLEAHQRELLADFRGISSMQRRALEE